MSNEPASPTMPEDDALAAEYALGLLPAEERKSFEKRLRDDFTLRASVASWDKSLPPLADAFDPVAPPTGALVQIEQRLFPRNAQTRKQGLLSSLWFWRGSSAVATAAALFMAVALYPPTTSVGPGGQAFIAQLQNEERALSIAAYFEPGSDTLVLTRTSGAPDYGRVFELWLIASESAPVSLGTLPTRERVEVVLASDLVAQLELGAALAISHEPDGGSPTGQPTGDILAVGPVSALQI